MNRRVLSLIILLSTWSFFTQAQSISKLDPQNFEKKINESKEPIVVDVRTSSEYAQGHLANAILIDIYSDDFKSQVAKLDKSKPVFVYCKAGSRSHSAVGIFQDLGFKEIYDLSGGINAWQSANKPIEKK